MTGNKSERVKTHRRNDRNQLQINMGHNTSVRRNVETTRVRRRKKLDTKVEIKLRKESPMKQKVNAHVGGGTSATSKKNCARTAANVRKLK